MAPLCEPSSMMKSVGHKLSRAPTLPRSLDSSKAPWFGMQSKHSNTPDAKSSTTGKCSCCWGPHYSWSNRSLERNLYEMARSAKPARAEPIRYSAIPARHAIGCSFNSPFRPRRLLGVSRQAKGPPWPQRLVERRRWSRRCDVPTPSVMRCSHRLSPFPEEGSYPTPTGWVSRTT